MNDEQVKVIYNDPPVHCIDVCDTKGERVIHIRPDARGATFSCSVYPSVASLTKEALSELASALETLSR